MRSTHQLLSSRSRLKYGHDRSVFGLEKYLISIRAAQTSEYFNSLQKASVPVGFSPGTLAFIVILYILQQNSLNRTLVGLNSLMDWRSHALMGQVGIWLLITPGHSRLNRLPVSSSVSPVKWWSSVMSVVRLHCLYNSRILSPCPTGWWAPCRCSDAPEPRVIPLLKWSWFGTSLHAGHAGLSEAALFRWLDVGNVPGAASVFTWRRSFLLSVVICSVSAGPEWCSRGHATRELRTLRARHQTWRNHTSGWSKNYSDMC